MDLPDEQSARNKLEALSYQVATRPAGTGLMLARAIGHRKMSGGGISDSEIALSSTGPYDRHVRESGYGCGTSLETGMPVGRRFVSMRCDTLEATL